MTVWRSLKSLISRSDSDVANVSNVQCSVLQITFVKNEANQDLFGVKVKCVA